MCSIGQPAICLQQGAFPRDNRVRRGSWILSLQLRLGAEQLAMALEGYVPAD